MGHYRFVSLRNAGPTEEAINKAKTLESLSDILEVSKCFGEYLFTEDAELTDLFRKAKSIAIERKVSDSGVKSYRAAVVTESGKYLCRLYGNGKGADYVERTLSADEIKKVTFGFCTTDGEKVTETRSNADGVVKVPVIYMNVRTEEATPKK